MNIMNRRLVCKKQALTSRHVIAYVTLECFEVAYAVFSRQVRLQRTLITKRPHTLTALQPRDRTDVVFSRHVLLSTVNRGEFPAADVTLVLAVGMLRFPALFSMSSFVMTKHFVFVRKSHVTVVTRNRPR